MIIGHDGLTHPVHWDGIFDERVGKRALVLFQNGSTSLVCAEALLSTASKKPFNLESVEPPTCVLSGCDKPVAQGICPRYGGCKSACCLAHYIRARDTESFVHPGFIVPGMKLTTTCVPSSAHVASSLPPSPKRAATNTTLARPLVDLKAVGRRLKSVVDAADSHSLHVAWMDRAMAIKEPRADFVSIFDGESGALNDAAAIFGLKGLPPVDVVSPAFPLDV